jgi:hypothetical protein
VTGPIDHGLNQSEGTIVWPISEGEEGSPGTVLKAGCGNVRSVRVGLVALFGSALALSACSSPSTPRVLTSADIPSYLGVKSNPSATASGARSVSLAPCKTTAVDAFGVTGKHKNTGHEIVAPFIFSVAFTCDSISQAQTAFKLIKGGRDGHAVAGIGDEAWINGLRGSAGQMHALGWRKGSRVSIVLLEGKSTDKRITAGLAEMLARRVVARSS